MVQCRLCGKTFPLAEMSEEHYPAHSVGNDDIVALDIVKLMDSFHSPEISKRISESENSKECLDDYFDNELSKPLYPKGRTARTLCRECNTFLGKYDEAYLKFFNCYGDPNTIKGFQQVTKIQIIKSIFGKFLSIPETQQESFDFVGFLRDEKELKYSGAWNLYFVKRDYSSDIMGLKDIGTGKIHYDEGDVYELSDDKFIFNLMNFPKHACYEMTDIFEILNKNYTIVNGVGTDGGYHSLILMTRLFQSLK